MSQAGRPAYLELRLEEHKPTRVRLKDGTRLDEPAGIEGYLDRIRPSSQFKNNLYLSTHDGYIFFTSAAQAEPPPPPGPPPDVSDPDALRREEALRGARQILSAYGMCDMRSIVAVRRAFQTIPLLIEEVDVRDTPEWEDTPGFWEAVEHFDEDHRDPGGPEGLKKMGDALTMRMRRSFELVLKSGHVVRFEVSGSTVRTPSVYADVSVGIFLPVCPGVDITIAAAHFILEETAPGRCTERDGCYARSDRSSQNHTTQTYRP